MSQVMVHMKNQAREMAYAQFGTKRFVGLQDVAIDLNRLTEPGYWAIIGTFEGSWLLLKFEKEYENPIDYQGNWNGIDPNNWISSMNQTEYESAVEGLREHISKGDVYQANICRVLATEISSEGFDIEGLANLLTTGNPAPYSCVISVKQDAHERLTKDVALVSASPELFLERSKQHISSSPIKGTGKTAQDLTEKDRAENVMIVDLVRNDLSQVCQTGSVKVPSLLETQVHPGLVHLVSTVEGQLKEEITWSEIFDATFPPGSVSGAPKISALNLIKKFEKSARGPYCGAIGWINTFNDTALIAVGIRTFWKDKNQLLFGTGAGITWGSEPLKEWQETELKCAKLFEVASKTHSK
jgi:para-aminobenzoate synthetase component 1